MVSAKHRKVLALALSASIFLAACGSGDQNSDSKGSDEQTADQSVTDLDIRPEVSALLPEALDAKLSKTLPETYSGEKPLVMATDATMGEPIATLNQETKRIDGYTVDLAQALGYVLGKDVEVVNTPFDSFIPGLQAERYDFSMSIMLDTMERQKSVDFVDYMVDGSSLLVAADSDINDLTLADMCGLKVGALRGSVESGYLEEQNKECAASSQIDANIYQGNNEMFLAVISGRIDVMMGPSAQLSFVQSMSKGKVREGGEAIGQALDGIAIGKTSGLTDPVHRALQELIDDGAYLEILELWGMQSNAVQEATINNATF